MWDDHIIPCAQRSKAERGSVSNSSINENKSLRTIISQLLTQMKTLCLSSVVGFWFLFLVSLQGFPVGNPLIVMDTGKPLAGELTQSQFQQGLEVRHLGDTEDGMAASLWTFSFLSSWLRKQ